MRLSITGSLVCGTSTMVFLLVFAALLSTVGPVIAQSQDELTSETRASAYRQFMLGRHLEGEDDVEGAIDAFRASARLDPTAAEPLAELAALYARAGRVDAAILTGEEALARESDNRTAHRFLGLTHASPAGGRNGTGTPLDADRAIRHLEQARGSLLPDLQVDLTLARLYIRTEALDEAITLLEELLRDELGFVEAALLLVRAYEEAGRPDDALNTLETAVFNGRPSYRAMARLGEMYEQRQRWREAAAAYESAVALNPRNANVRRRLASVLLEFGEADRALSVLKELIGMRPRDAASLHLLAEVELGLNNFEAAESIARQLIDLEPDGFRGPFVLAQVFGRRREHQAVVDTLQAVLDDARTRNVRPERLVGAFVLLGFAYEQLGDQAGTVRVYEEAVELLPQSLTFKARLARAYADVERYGDATRVLATARTDHPGDLTLALIEAEMYSSRGDIDQSELLLLDALEINQQDPRGFVALANFYSKHQRLGDAVTVLQSAQQRFPGDISILFQLGAVFEQDDRFVDAEQAFRQLLDRDPEHAPTLNYLGYMLADRGERLEESVSLIEKAVEKDPHNGSYLDSLGWAYFKLGRLDLAEFRLRAAGEQLQNNSVVQDHLGDLFNRLGRYTEAIEAWERALAGDGDEIDADAIGRKINDARQRVVR